MTMLDALVYKKMNKDCRIINKDGDREIGIKGDKFIIIDLYTGKHRGEINEYSELGWEVLKEPVYISSVVYSCS